MSATPDPIRVVVVEDSLLQRSHLVRLLQAQGSITVVGEAGTVEEAVAVVGRLRPDVVTMDLEIPGGRPERPGGIVAIEQLSHGDPVPILVLSSHVATRHDTLAIEALAAGAVDVHPKPPTWSDADAASLRRRIAVCSRVEMVRRRRPASRPDVPRGGAGGPAVVGLAASTGGPSALRTVIGGLGGIPAPILVVQHIHADFCASFASWLQDVTGLPSALAEDGEEAAPGRVYVAPPHTHLRLAPGRRLALDPEPELLSRPSCDELLRSLAQHAGPSAVAAVLTGMGDDGARGLLAVRQRGGRTFAQDGESAVVDGMPRAARELGAASRTVSIEAMAPAILDAVGQVHGR